MSVMDLAKNHFDKRFLASLSVGEKPFVQNAWSEYLRLGLPGRNTEAWKYTDFSEINKKTWSLDEASQPAFESPQILNLQKKWGSQFQVIVVSNGTLAGDLPKGFAKVDYSKFLNVEFNDGWLGLCAALARPGLRFHVSKEYDFDKPVLIVHHRSTSQGGARSWTPLIHQIKVESGLKLELAEAFVGDGVGLTSDLMNVELDNGAELCWLRLQGEGLEAFHYSDIQCSLGQAAKLYFTQINSGARWSRSSISVSINGRAAEAHVSGLTFGADEQHCDQRIVIKHNAAESVSAQLFKGVLKDHARGILNGKIFISKNAQKVNSSQLNHNLLLSPKAEAYTKPELEIYADDVKANHGASIGKLDEDRIFYLMSRGIPRAQCERLLAQAFVEDVLMKINSKHLSAFAHDMVWRIQGGCPS